MVHCFPRRENPIVETRAKSRWWWRGVSGRPAQKHNWGAVIRLAEQKALPVIGPSAMEFKDIEKLRKYGASAISFGTIHLRTPWKPTSLVMRDLNRKQYLQTIS